MKKKILIYSGVNLFPKIMANQDRIFNLIRELSKVHVVDLAMVYRSEQQRLQSAERLGPYLNAFHPLKAVNPIGNPLKRSFYKVRNYLLSILTGLPPVYFYLNNKKHIRLVKGLLENNSYDIFQTEYWFFSRIFFLNSKPVFTAIDNHALSFDGLILRSQFRYGENIPFHVRRMIRKIIKQEITVYNKVDLVISISRYESGRLRELGATTPDLVIKAGQNVGHFSGYGYKPEENTVIFYGNMGSEQNILAFDRFWNSIYPVLLEKNPDARVIVIGSNPPPGISMLQETNDRIRVTGFVDDVREYLSKGMVLIIPLEVGVGFRCRIIDVMAMGIPVVGTHNALDSVEMEHGREGFITDNDREMAEYLYRILLDKKLRHELSENCKRFVRENYTFEKTYAALSRYYEDLEITTS